MHYGASVSEVADCTVTTSEQHRQDEAVLRALALFSNSVAFVLAGIRRAMLALRVRVGRWLSIGLACL